jgi:hypothetical protein
MRDHLERSFNLAIAVLCALLAAAPVAFGATGGCRTRTRLPGHGKPSCAPRPGRKPGTFVEREPSRRVFAAPGTLLGESSLEWQHDSLPAGQAEAFRLRASASGVAVAVHVYLGAGSTAGSVIAGLYGSASDRPGRLLSAGASSTARSGAWATVPIAPRDLTAGGVYWVAILAVHGRLRYRDRPHGPCLSETSARRGLHALPATWKTDATYSDCPASVFVTSAASPGAAASGDTGAGDVGHSPLTAVLSEQAIALPAPPGDKPAATEAPPAPTNVSPPEVIGTPESAQTLTATAGTWTGSPTFYAYRWQDCDSSGDSCAEAKGEGARSSAYTLTREDVGHTMRVLVTASNEGGASSALSSHTKVVAAATHRTFYVSYEGGSESNSGESEAQAWQRAPGMQGFTHPYTHEAGDHFIFKGGVRWPHATLPLIATGSGTPGNEDYYGVNETWYAGSSYEAPVFDAEGRHIEVVPPGSSTRIDDMLFLNKRDYITVEGIHFENWNAKELPAGGYGCDGISMNNEQEAGDEHVHLNRIGFTGWTSDWQTVEGKGYTCKVISTYTQKPADNSLTNSTIEGREGEAFGWEVSCMSRVEGNVIGRSTALVEPCPDKAGTAVIAGNTLFDCGYPKWPAGAQMVIHGDVMQSLNSSLNETDYIYDNVVYGTGYTGEGVFGGAAGSEGECESGLLGGEEGAGKVTVYMWNNVYYDIGGNSPQVDRNAQGWFAWNNAFEGGEQGKQTCLNGPAHESRPSEVVWENNFCISAEPGKEGVREELLAATGHTTVDHDLVFGGVSQIAAHHYATVQEVAEGKAPFVFAPTSPQASGVGRGANLDGLCSGELASLCEDTSYGGMRTPRRRAEGSPWDIGAYQW